MPTDLGQELREQSETSGSELRQQLLYTSQP